MALAVPVAVRFLRQGNQELSRNMSSYLSLAAIAKAELLAQHTEDITCSVLGGKGPKWGKQGVMASRKVYLIE